MSRGARRPCRLERSPPRRSRWTRRPRPATDETRSLPRRSAGRDRDADARRRLTSVCQLGRPALPRRAIRDLGRCDQTPALEPRLAAGLPRGCRHANSQRLHHGYSGAARYISHFLRLHSAKRNRSYSLERACNREHWPDSLNGRFVMRGSGPRIPLAAHFF
jgi:hypothetical protein